MFQSDKIKIFSDNIKSIAEAAKVFNPSFNVRTIFKNLESIENLYIHEIMIKDVDKFLEFLKSSKRDSDSYDLFGRIERDNELIDYLIDNLKQEQNKIAGYKYELENANKEFGT